MILRVCICIPTYNNPTSIEKVVLDCLNQTQFPILIVDDGSSPAVIDQLKSAQVLEAIQSKRVSLLRWVSNQGKGVALQAGFRDCLKKGFTHMVCLDGDGQHLASEISKLTALALEHPWDLIVGNRKLSQNSVPQVSKFGRAFSNFWVGFQTRTQIADSQSGFRLYPLFQIQNMKFWTKRFDFEIEVLIRLLWKKVGIQEVEIECYYPDPKDRVSHFHKFWDNFRISCLNTLLVILTVFQKPDSPILLGLAVGIGVLVGCTPFLGFHTLIISLIAVVFRLNWVYLWIGTHVSIPPLAPVLALGSVAIGKKLLHVSGHSIRGLPLTWLVGSLVLGAGLGSVLGMVAVWISQRSQSQSIQKKQNWSGQSRGGKYGNLFLKTVTQKFGLKPAYFFLYWIIPYFYLFAPKARRSSQEYWQTLRPELSFWKKRFYVCRHLFNFGMTLLDRVYQNSSQPESKKLQIRSNGMEYIRSFGVDQPGAILLSAHVGSFEIAGANLRSDGFLGEFYMLRYEAQKMTVNQYLGEQKSENLKNLFGNQVDLPLLKVRQILEEGKLIGMMADRPISGHFELVSFFGKLVPMDGTPFKVAASCQSSLIITFGFKGKGMSYDFFAEPPKKYSYLLNENKTLQNFKWVQEFAQIFERYVSKYPDQWFNFFPIFSAVPVPPQGIEFSKSRNYLVEEFQKPKVKQFEEAVGSRPSV